MTTFVVVVVLILRMRAHMICDISHIAPEAASSKHAEVSPAYYYYDYARAHTYVWAVHARVCMYVQKRCTARGNLTAPDTCNAHVHTLIHKRFRLHVGRKKRPCRGRERTDSTAGQ